MSESTSTAPTMSRDELFSSVIAYGDVPDPVYSFTLGNIPFYNLLQLAQKGLTQFLGAEGSAKVTQARVKAIKAWMEANPSEADADEVFAKLKKNTPDEIFSQADEVRILNDFRSAMAEQIRTGTVGRSERKTAVSEFASDMRSLAQTELKAAGVEFGKKLGDSIKNDLTNVATGQVFTGTELISVYIKNHEDRLRKELDRRAVAAKKQAERMTAGGNELGASLGLALA